MAPGIVSRLGRRVAPGPARRHRDHRAQARDPRGYRNVEGSGRHPRAGAHGRDHRHLRRRHRALRGRGRVGARAAAVLGSVVDERDGRSSVRPLAGHRRIGRPGPLRPRRMAGPVLRSARHPDHLRVAVDGPRHDLHLCPVHDPRGRSGAGGDRARRGGRLADARRIGVADLLPSDPAEHPLGARVRDRPHDRESDRGDRGGADRERAPPGQDGDRDPVHLPGLRGAADPGRVRRGLAPRRRLRHAVGRDRVPATPAGARKDPGWRSRPRGAS